MDAHPNSPRVHSKKSEMASTPSLFRELEEEESDRYGSFKREVHSPKQEGISGNDISTSNAATRAILAFGAALKAPLASKSGSDEDLYLSRLIDPARTPKAGIDIDTACVRNLAEGVQQTEANSFCFCGERFGDESSLKRHQKRAHYMDNKTTHSDDNETKPICDICGRVFKKSQDKIRHISICHANDRFKCPECSAPFSSSRAMTSHRQEAHDVKGKKRSRSIVAYKCDFCTYSCKWKGNLRRHIAQAHLRHRKYPCKICGLQFGTSNNLNVHLMTCTRRKEALTCKRCGGVSMNRALFQHHTKFCMM